MRATLLAISAAYVVMAVLLLAWALSSRFAWWVKAIAIVVTSVFFVEVFFATKGLLGWPGVGHAAAALPAAVDAGGRARSQDQRSGRDLSLGRGGRREQRAEPASRAPIGCPIPSRLPTARSRRATRSWPATRRKAPPRMSATTRAQAEVKQQGDTPTHGRKREPERSCRQPRSRRAAESAARRVQPMSGPVLPAKN